MFHSLYSRIAAVLFLLVCLIGYVVYSMVLYSSEMYQQELTQKLNAQLAQHIVEEKTLFINNSELNQPALKSLFHSLMVVNPSIEIYLLDPDGKILSFFAPAGHVKRQQVSLQPIQAFLSGTKQYPLMGDDPRSLQANKKVFSAARIPNSDPSINSPAGYLYVILEGEAYASTMEMIKGSYILQFTTTGLGAGLILAMLAGLLAFAYLTKRLRLLSQIIASYDSSGYHTRARYPVGNKAGDEIDGLGKNFNLMADRIDQQLEDLKTTDAKRREMVANVSHDLRTPLTSLHGYLETLLLKDEKLSPAERREYLEIATAQSGRLSQLIRELFELAKLDSSETLINLEPFSLAELAQDVVHKFGLEAEKRNIQLQTAFGNNLPFAYGDIGLIQRVLDNLIENALRYTPSGGNITLSVMNDSDNIVVKVADTGQGIPEEEISHIFDRFYRLEKTRTTSNKNAGLGLAIVKRIIDLHGSNISAHSTPNMGTTFSFALHTSP